MNYAYYKFYRICVQASSWSIAGISAALLLGGLVTINLSVVLWCLNRNGIIDLPHLQPYIPVGFGMTLILCFPVIYNSKRSDRIIKKYETETRKQKYLGNTILAIYITL